MVELFFKWESRVLRKSYRHGVRRRDIKNSRRIVEDKNTHWGVIRKRILGIAMVRVRAIHVLRICKWHKEKISGREVKDWLEEIDTVIWVNLNLKIGVFGVFYFNCNSPSFLITCIPPWFGEDLIVYQKVIVCFWKNIICLLFGNSGRFEGYIVCLLYCCDLWLGIIWLVRTHQGV